MTDLASRLDMLRVRAEVPGGLLAGEFRDRSEVVLSFGGSGYYRSTEADLEEQIVALCRLLVVAWSRGYWDLMSEVQGSTIVGEPPALTDADGEFRDARDHMLVEGRSADGRISVTFDGQRGWSAAVQPGTLVALSEEEFIAGAREASQQLVQSHRSTIGRLKAEIYGRAAIERPSY